MKTVKTFEAYRRKDDEKYPYPIYHEALLQYLPSVFLFSDFSDLPEYNYTQRFACDISDFTCLSDDVLQKTLAGFADNAFDGEGIDFLRKVETQIGDRFEKTLVGGIPTPAMGGRSPEELDIHGDTLYFFGEETESNKVFLEDLCEHYDELSYYEDQGFYRVWWD